MRPEPHGLPTLAKSDAWWRNRWAQHQSTAELAARYGVPVEDVWARLQKAGVELRGRPPAGQRKLFELPPRQGAVFVIESMIEHRDGMERDTREITALTRRAACWQARQAIWAESHEGRDNFGVVSCRVIERRSA